MSNMIMMPILRADTIKIHKNKAKTEHISVAEVKICKVANSIDLKHIHSHHMTIRKRRILLK